MRRKLTVCFTVLPVAVRRGPFVFQRPCSAILVASSAVYTAVAESDRHAVADAAPHTSKWAVTVCTGQNEQFENNFVALLLKLTDTGGSTFERHKHTHTHKQTHPPPLPRSDPSKHSARSAAVARAAPAAARAAPPPPPARRRRRCLETAKKGSTSEKKGSLF